MFDKVDDKGLVATIEEANRAEAAARYGRASGERNRALGVQ